MNISEILKDYSKGDVLVCNTGNNDYQLCEYIKILNGLVLVKDEHEIRYAIKADQCKKYDPGFFQKSDV